MKLLIAGIVMMMSVLLSGQVPARAGGDAMDKSYLQTSNNQFLSDQIDNASLRTEASLIAEPATMVCLGIFLLAMASYGRRVSHRKRD
jgi:hypothetical protein